MERNIIFSLRGTVIYDDLRTFLRTLWKDEGRALRLYEAVFSSPEWRMLEEGSITREDAMEWLCRRHPTEAEHIRLVLKHWLRCLTPRWETVELLLDMKGQRTFWFTASLNKDGKDYILKNYPFISLFEGGIFSCDAGGHMIDYLCDFVVPAQSLFVSADPKDQESAEAAGFRSLLFTGVDRLRDILM